MSTLAKAENVELWTPDQKALIKNTVAKDATDDELKMFLHVAGVSGLDPLLKQIHFTKMGGRIAFIADVNGLQARAARSPDFKGIDCAVVYEKDEFLIDQKTGEVLRHANNPFVQGKPVGAWAVVHREGMRPFVSCVRFVEYVNPSNALWGTKPSVMILKCAKSTALRLAYPERFSGIYDEAELGKEERELNPAPPAPATEQATHAAAVKQQLRKRFQVVDQKEGETEEQATARTNAEEGKGAITVWERIQVLAREYGVEPVAMASIIRGATGKPDRTHLVDSDVAMVAAALEYRAKYPATGPPPPSDADMPAT